MKNQTLLTALKALPGSPRTPPGPASAHSSSPRPAGLAALLRFTLNVTQQLPSWGLRLMLRVWLLPMHRILFVSF